MNKHINIAELVEEGIHHIMPMRNDGEALRVLLQEGDLDLEWTIFVGITEP